MHGATVFNAIAHASTAYYYYHVLRFIADIRAPSADPVLRDFFDFRPKFFTIWGVATQALLFVLCSVHDVTRLLPPSNAVRRAARYLRDLVLVALAGPFAVTVAVMFWSLFLLDRELVMPAVLDQVIPPWLNHAMHSFVVVLVVVQILAEPHRPPPLGAAIALASAVSIAYLYVIFGEYASTGRWIYPIFSLLDWFGRVALSVFTVALCQAQVVFFRAIVAARWGDNMEGSRMVKRNKD